MIKILSLALTVTLLVSCQKSNFLYYQSKPTMITVGFDHKIKEIKGQKNVDILWIIDNSGSMRAHQDAVKNNAQQFMQAFLKRNLEWRMGIISTSVFEEPYLGLDVHRKGLTPLNYLFDFRTPNPMSDFGLAVSNLGTRGNGSAESTFVPVWDALNQYPDFLRKDAMLALLIVTDAPEQSEKLVPGNGMTSPYLGATMRVVNGKAQRIAYRNLNGAPNNARKFYDHLVGLKKDPKKIVAYGAFAAVDLGCQVVDEFENYYGSEYEKIIQLTNGKVFPLCTKDFGTQLGNFGEDLASRMSHPQIPLRERPEQDSLKVYYRGQLLRSGLEEDNGQWFYHYERNAVYFHNLDFAQGDSEQVRIEYRVRQ